MSNPFRSHIRNSLVNTNLQAALDANAERRIAGRINAFATLSNPAGLRQRAHSIREDVIEHLEGYLEQFSAQAQANGVQIHRAVDAAEAVKIVLDIASDRHAKLIAKSKTMVSEEIGLNAALEQQGLRVVETDLGEYIVQLRGETPSHIITPAVHLRRQDVGKVFEQELGLPYTEEISLMTNAARRELRQVFLQADIGISGVNFGVVDTGTLCIVTNEGNGRMVTTLPRTHIALMGLERLVPSMQDLALMLSLLPRSATGQKLSVYTSLLNSPRRAEDPDGPQERHVILVDNGRRAVLSSELRESLYCIRCGSCLNACPVFREIGGHAYVGISGKGSPYPGPIGSVISPALFGQLEYGHLARASSLCAACREACPVDIDLPKLLLRIRAGIGVDQNQGKPKPNAPMALATGLQLFSLAASSPRFFVVAQWLAGLIGSLVRNTSKDDAWIRLPKITGWGYSKDFPAPVARTFRSRYNHQGKDSSQLKEQQWQPDSGNIVRQENAISQEESQQDLLNRFVAELEELGGKFSLCSPEEAITLVVTILRERNIETVLSWDVDNLLVDIPVKLAEAGIQVRYPTNETLEASSTIKAGVTGVVAGVAETGSLLLLSGRGRPLISSLLPGVHIALIREKDIYGTLLQLLEREDLKEASAGVLVTGPSRTADIEMTLTIGVHGPGELHVICLRDLPGIM